MFYSFVDRIYRLRTFRRRNFRKRNSWRQNFCWSFEHIFFWKKARTFCPLLNFQLFLILWKKVLQLFLALFCTTTSHPTTNCYWKISENFVTKKLEYEPETVLCLLPGWQFGIEMQTLVTPFLSTKSRILDKKNQQLPVLSYKKQWLPT